MEQAHFVKVYTDDHGESHFAEVTFDLQTTNFAPPASPMLLAELFPSKRCFLLSAPPDWDGGVFHPTPRRQLFCFVRGQLDIGTSDGEVRRLGPGSLILLEDTTGKGHSSRVVGSQNFLLLGIALED